jgi:heme iron utilization protein
MKLEQIVATDIGCFQGKSEGQAVETPKHDASVKAKALILRGGTAALSVVDLDEDKPFVTLVNVAAGAQCQPLILISDLSHHAKCLRTDPRASLLLTAPIADGDPMLTFRVTLQGVFSQVDHDPAFLARHPYAEMYAGFGDFHMWRMEPDHAHIIAGFGRAYGVRFKDIAAA